MPYIFTSLRGAPHYQAHGPHVVAEGGKSCRHRVSGSPAHAAVRDGLRRAKPLRWDKMRFYAMVCTAACIGRSDRWLAKSI
jgi:hypothetical protein